jgi:hypothetical protein
MRAAARLSHAGWKAGGGCAKLKHRGLAELTARSVLGKPAPAEADQPAIRDFAASNPIY